MTESDGDRRPATRCSVERGHRVRTTTSPARFPYLSPFACRLSLLSWRRRPSWTGSGRVVDQRPVLDAVGMRGEVEEAGDWLRALAAGQSACRRRTGPGRPADHAPNDHAVRLERK